MQLDKTTIKENNILKIKKLVKDVGVPLNILGYKYISTAIYKLIDAPKSMSMSEIYNIIALKNLTSPECVEAAVRNAIKKAAFLSTPTFRKIFKNSNSISNSLFLIMMKNFLECD